MAGWEEYRKTLYKKIRDDKKNKALILDTINMIIETRKAKGLSQKGLAKLMGTKQSAIARLESGKFNMSLKYLQKLANAFDLDLEPPRFKKRN